MADYSEDESVMVENAIGRALEVIAMFEETPEVVEVKEILVEAQQIVTSKIEGSGSEKEMIAEGTVSGPGV